MKKSKFSLLSDKIILVISSIASAVLTELIVELFSTDEYSVIYNEQANESIQIVQNNSGIGKIVLVILGIVALYSLLFILLKQLIPLLDYFFKPRYTLKERYTQRQLVASYNNIKEEICKLYSESHRKDIQEEELIIQFSSIIAHINSLHTKFIRGDKKTKTIINQIFRDKENADVNRIGEYISLYEYKALLTLVESLMQEVLNTKYKVYIQNDIISLQKEINNLKALAKY
jgi:hypothetical protein